MDQQQTKVGGSIQVDPPFSCQLYEFPVLEGSIFEAPYKSGSGFSKREIIGSKRELTRA